MRFNGFCGGAYQARAISVDAEALENLIPTPSEGFGKNHMYLLGTPGTRVYLQGLDGVPRAMKETNGRMFVLGRQKFYEITEPFGGVPTLTDRSGGISLAHSWQPGTISGPNAAGQLLITTGNPGLGYIYNLATNTLAQITDPEFPTDVVMGWFLNTFFGVLRRDYKTIDLSAPNNGSSWPGDSAQKDVTADPIRAVVPVGERLRLMGDEVTENWYFTGAEFPYAGSQDAMLIGNL